MSSFTKHMQIQIKHSNVVFSFIKACVWKKNIFESEHVSSRLLYKWVYIFLQID